MQINKALAEYLELYHKGEANAVTAEARTALNFKIKVFLRQILPCADKITLFSSISPLRQLHFNVQYATIRKKK